MIHIFIGTKAQFIKMAPVMMEMNRRGMPYHLIETGQHAALTADLIGEFGLREADTRLRRRLNNIATLRQAALWTFGRRSFASCPRRKPSRRKDFPR